MLKALYTSATGLNAQQLVVDNTANNLANSNTTGFKQSAVDFEDLIYETTRQPGSEITQNLQTPIGLQIGSGVRVTGTTKLFTEGNLQNTNNPLNIAIQGDGFLKVVLPSGDFRYTRDGNLQMNSSGQLVNADGFLVQPNIKFPQDTTSITIGVDGTVSVTTASQPNQTSTVGSLTLTRFPNNAGLSADGGDLYAETPASGAGKDTTPGLNGTGTLLQNYLEGSNVNVVQELVNLIQAQRSYEFNTRAMNAVDQMLAATSNITR